MALSQLGRGIIILTLLGSTMAVVLNYPDHIFGPWELHARVHVFQAVCWTVGLNVLGMLVTLRFYKETWALKALALIGLFIFGGFFLPHFATPNPLGEPADSDGWLGFGIMTFAYIIGLILTYLSHKSKK